jgi:hypothetical protein
VYDITDRASFVNIRAWMNQIHMHADVGVNKVLVGNKLDLENHERGPRVSYFGRDRRLRRKSLIQGCCANRRSHRKKVHC